MKPFRLFLTLLLITACWTMPQQALAIDADGDGHHSIASGGDDCDDHDRNRYPGNVEVCDANNHDEDCNPHTFSYGLRDDRDGDGLTDHRCCNIAADGQRYCGNDCDDNNRAIQTNSQVCDGERVVLCGTDGQYVQASCPGSTICVIQPNRTGVCMTKPAGYVAPPPRGLANTVARPSATMHRTIPVPRSPQPATRISPVKPAPSLQ